MSKRSLWTRDLENVLGELCTLRGMTPAEVVHGAEPWCNRATVYRVLAGGTADPHTSTLAAICRALQVRPQEMFERCGLWDGGPGAARHAEVRALWAGVAMLPPQERLRITQVVRTLVDAAQREREQAQTR